MKRVFYILLIVLACTLMVLLTGVALLRSERVQTAMTRYLTVELARGLGVQVDVERVSIHFFNGLDVHGVYMSDQAGDTLLSVPKLTVRFNPLALDEKRLQFPLVELNSPYVFLKQDSLSTNIDFLMRAFASSDTVDSDFPYVVALDAIRVTDARLRYKHLPTGRDVMLNDMDIFARLPYLAADSVSAFLDALHLNLRLRGVDAYAEADFSGNLDSITAHKLELYYRGQRMLLGRLDANNILKPEQLQTLVDCQDLYCNHALLQDLLSDLLAHPVHLPAELRPLGDVHYRGTLQGGLENLVLHGVFLTQLGSVSTDCVLHTDTSFADIALRGKVATKRFRLGRMLPGKGFGKVSFTADVDGRYRRDMPLNLKGDLQVYAFDYKDFTYQNLHVNGQLADSVFTGKMGITDPNIDFHFNGTLDFSQQMPLADCRLRVNHLRLGELNLWEGAKNQDLQFTCNVNMSANEGKGNWLDRLNGRVWIDSLLLANDGQALRMKEMVVTLHQQDTTSLRIYSDFMTARINGDFRWSSLPATFTMFMHQVLPNTVKAPKRNKRHNSFEFYCYLMKVDSLLAVTSYRNIDVPRTITLHGSLDEAKEKYEMQFLVPRVERKNSELQNVAFAVRHKGKETNVGLSLKEHTISYDSTQLRIGDINMSVHTRIRSDSLLTYILFDDEENDKDDDAGITVNTYIGKRVSKPYVSVHVLPSQFYMRDTVWTLTDSRIDYLAADTTLTVSDFCLQSEAQYVKVNGMASNSNADSIHVDLKNINLRYFLQYVGINNAVAIDGLVSGWATIYGLFSKPMFEAKVTVPDARLNYTSIGDLTATAELDRQTNHILIVADAIRNGHHDVHLTGNVIPEDSYWELFIHADGADLRLVNFWTEGFLSDIIGKGYGDVHVFGKRLNTWVTAKMYADKAALTIPFTGARYYLSDSLMMDTTSISFPSITIRDADGHKGVVNGIITHELFKKFKYHISGQVNDILALDIPYSSQQMYYGKVYASGSVDIKGDDNQTDIKVFARSGKKTDFYLCVNTASDAADNSFIEFADNTVLPIFAQQKKEKEEEKKVSNSSKVNLSMMIDATPDATVHVMLDSHSGDGITGNGEGNLRFTMDAGGDVKLYGTYTMQEGTFSYAVGNIIRRNFSIVNGSSVSWSGDPLSPMLNASAKYRVTASLRDLFGDDMSQLATNRSSIPVECILYISDRLFNPVLRFGIELPQSDEAVASQVKSVINSEEMLMRQVVYLLAFNRFFTPEYMQNTSSSVANETYSLLSSTVTGQINAWLSRLTNIVSVGFNFRTDGEGASASQEYETQFQLRPVDRLSINGNFGYRYNDISDRPFYGDVDIEYQLTPNGKVRAKAFTHTVDKYSLKQASTVQGVGFVFRHDFNRGDARQRKNLKKQQ